VAKALDRKRVYLHDRKKVIVWRRSRGPPGSHSQRGEKLRILENKQYARKLVERQSRLRVGVGKILFPKQNKDTDAADYFQKMAGNRKQKRDGIICPS